MLFVSGTGFFRTGIACFWCDFFEVVFGWGFAKNGRNLMVFSLQPMVKCAVNVVYKRHFSDA
jgi:hypothetical protein